MLAIRTWSIALIIVWNLLFITGCSNNKDSGAPLITDNKARLSKTGQLISHDSNTLLPSDDGALRKGVAWPEPRFTVGTGIERDCITDNLTGLMWQRNGETNLLWDRALFYSRNLVLCGHTDWRLPNRNELQSLVNSGAPVNNAAWLNDQGFINVMNAIYWSSTTYAYDDNYAWALLGNGELNPVGPKSDPPGVFVLSVRNNIKGIITLPQTGQSLSYGSYDDGELRTGLTWPVPRFTLGTGADADCVTDNLTGLMWEKAPNPDLIEWQAALDVLDGFDLCGHTDWRLPNRNELDSLVNIGEPSPAGWLNAQGFINVQDHYYWTSTSVEPPDPYLDLAWYVSLYDGCVAPGIKNDYRYGRVWAVRGD